jgi:hypothetical protein
MKPLVLSLSLVLAAPSWGLAQQKPLDRLPPSVLDVTPPSARVNGTPGTMRITQTACRSLPAAQVRRRIVELAAQEWGYFGFTIVDQTEFEEDGFQPRGRRRPGDAQSMRVADSIAGYWTVAPGGEWILENQNKIWNGLDGASARWRFPWSAAFVSWVMCESGLGNSDQFQRAIAHHTYIDQAIRARDEQAPRAAFVAYDAGEAAVAPGDLLCTSRRPTYTDLAARRRQMGVGARTHCDIVVRVDDSASRFFAIGGNVRGSVSLKIVPAVSERGTLRPRAAGGRAVFAHLKLRAEPIEATAFDTTHTLRRSGRTLP